MAIAQLDLTNRPAGGINLPENYRRTVRDASLAERILPQHKEFVRELLTKQTNEPSQSN